MSWTDRWYNAEYANLTPIGRVVLTLIIIGLFLLPLLIFGPIEITDMEPRGWTIFLGNFMTVLIAIVVVIISIIIIFMVWMFVSWILTGRSGIDSLNFFLVEKLWDFTATLFRVFFGSYRDKWLFLYEMLHPDKVAKEMLDE